MCTTGPGRRRSDTRHPRRREGAAGQPGGPAPAPRPPLRTPEQVQPEVPRTRALPRLPRPARGAVRTRKGEEQMRAFLRGVDAGPGRQVREQAPVVLVGGERVLGEFLRLTRHGGAVAGLATGTRSRPSYVELEEIGRAAMREHVEDLATAARDTFEARLRNSDAVTGLLGCWHAASTRTPRCSWWSSDSRFPPGSWPAAATWSPSTTPSTRRLSTTRSTTSSTRSWSAAGTCPWSRTGRYGRMAGSP